MKLISSIALLFMSMMMSQPIWAQADTLSEVMQAGNKRDITDKHLIAGLSSDDPILVEKTLLVLGNIGGKQAAELIMTKLNDPRDNVRKMAAFAAGIAGDPFLFVPLREAVSVEKNPTIKARMYHSMGYIIPDELRSYLAIELTSTEDPVIRRGILDGYLQSITYKTIKASEMEHLNFNLLLKIATGVNDEAAAAAYLLNRSKELEAVISPKNLSEAASKAQSAKALSYIVRAMGQIKGDNSADILPYLSHPNLSVRLSAIRSMSKVSDPAHLLALQATGVHKSAVIRKAVIDVMANSEFDVVRLAGRQLIEKGIKDPSVWVQGAALTGLKKISTDAAENIAKSWVGNSSSYRMRYAVEVLKDNEEFRPEIENMLKDPSNPYLQNTARSYLDVTEEFDDESKEPTVSYALALSASRSKLLIETTKGVITIQLNSSAPYTSYNFVRLAEEKVLDGMLFHRVIGNFVAQAGERLTPAPRDWGMIREEWTNESHEIGTVGLATRGKDTGTIQFFFNTAHNRHLDGRYTIFGKVITGLDIMMAIDEGDRIIKVTVED